MKKGISLILLVPVLLSSCRVIGDIFKAGVWVGVLMAAGFIALVIYLINRGSNKN